MSSQQHTMITDTTVERQIRQTIKNAIINSDLQSLQRIAYETRCKQLGINPDGWKLYPPE